MTPLVTPAWLAARLDSPHLRIFDATKYLPTEGQNATDLFTQAHIPTAQFFDIDLFADPDDALPHMVPSQARFARLAQACGIGTQSQVVFYDQKGQASAARGWWLMRLFGHDQVALLDGGLPAWRAAGLPIATGDARPVPTGDFQPALRARLLAGLGDIAPSLAAGALLLDARPAGRFTGAAPEPRPGLPSGHIPGAISLPFTELLDPAGHFLPIPALRQRLAQAGVDGTRPVITSCGTGVTAAILAFALHHAGLAEAAVYDGSWTEWATRPDTVKETGA